MVSVGRCSAYNILWVFHHVWLAMARRAKEKKLRLTEIGAVEDRISRGIDECHAINAAAGRKLQD